MRFEGTLKTWNDERGFGFIEPFQGGQEVFVHVKAFNGRGARPVLNQRVSFEVEIGPQGKKRAKNVEPVRAARGMKRGRTESPAPWSLARVVAIPGFVVVYALVAKVWGVSGITAGVYVLASIVCFMVYALDKSAAIHGWWRTRESTLHFLGLACGWPGALLAQQLLPHKSSKPTFRAVFRGTVAANVAGFVAWHALIAPHLRA